MKPPACRASLETSLYLAIFPEKYGHFLHISRGLALLQAVATRCEEMQGKSVVGRPYLSSLLSEDSVASEMSSEPSCHSLQAAQLGGSGTTNHGPHLKTHRSRLTTPVNNPAHGCCTDSPCVLEEPGAEDQQIKGPATRTCIWAALATFGNTSVGGSRPRPASVRLVNFICHLATVPLLGGRLPLKVGSNRSEAPLCFLCSNSFTCAAVDGSPKKVS